MKLSKGCRRTRRERRKNKRSSEFPFRDKNGVIVSFERRIHSDRRTEGLELTVSDMSKKKFEEYFKNINDNSVR